jgi:molybdenum cofactor cytidylyltransferase
LKIGENVTTDAVIRVLVDPDGGLKNVPESARRIVLLNQSDTHELQATANGMVQPLLNTFDSVIIASVREERIHAVHEHIAGIVLAAGESTRYGQVKQLLDWRGVPFVRAIAQTAFEAGLSPVVIVTGANAEKIKSAINNLNVRVVHNEEWKSGQGSSIKAGISSIKDTRTGGAIFLLADQPQVTTSVIRALVEKHAEGLHTIVAPMVIDQRANPVLFDRSAFRDLMSIEGDTGGRAIFHKHRVEYLPWHDERLLLDVDTPEMYQRLISDETL